MEFDSELFKKEIVEMISTGIEKIKLKEDKIYTMSICIDTNSQYSSLHFDTKQSSDEFDSPEYRNYSPADFKYGDFQSFDNKSFIENWEDETDGKCWNVLSPILNQICLKLLQNEVNELKKHQDFILTCSGPNDWCEFEYQIN